MALSYIHLVCWLLGLLFLSQFSAGQSQQQGCVLRFDIQSSSSVLTLNGQSIKPLPVPIRATSNPQLAGSFYLKLAGTAGCPTQLTLASFSGATFVAPQNLNLSASYPPSLISMSPPVLYTRAGAGSISFANVTFYDVEVAVESPAITPDAQTGAFTVQQNWTVISGLTEERSILETDFTFFDMKDTPSTVNSPGTFSVSAQAATLSFPTFEWPLILLGGAENQEASYTFQGSVLATAVLGCPANCNFRGRCELQGSTPTCACDCGFAGTDCAQTSLTPLALEYATSAFPSTATAVTNDGNVHLELVGTSLGDFAASSNLSAFVGNASCGPLTRVSSSVATCGLPPQPDALNKRAPVQVVRGCQRTPRTLTSLVSVDPPSASAQAAPPSPTPEASVGTCPVDPDKQCAGVPATAKATGACTCDCLPGWTGVDCSVCTADDVCQALNLGARCDTGPLYGANTTNKAYGCKLTSSSLAAYIQSDMAIRCDVSKRACTILLDVLSDGGAAPVNCTATGCAFASGRGAFTCAELSCGCGGQKVPCPTDLSQTINTLTGGSKMACADDGSGKCTLSLDALPSDLEATCNIGECTNSGNVTFQASPGRHVDTTAIAVAVPVSVLGSAALVALAWYARKRQRARGEAEYVTWSAQNEKFAGGSKRGSGPGGVENGRVSDGGGGEIDRDRGGLSAGIVGVGVGRSGVGEGVNGGVHGGEMMNGARKEWSGKSPGRTLEVRKLSVLLSPGKWWRGASGKGVSRPHIVSDVSFVARPGEVLGVFGPSGGGKTTLLSVVAGVGGDRLGRVSVTGSVLLDGKERNDDYRLLTSLLPQDDLLYGTLTAQESIAYSAELRLPAFMPTELKRKRVDSTVALLGLSSVRHSRIGSLLGGRGLSGGERRRVRIGMELVTDCDVLLMDEPTSGLDSHRALKLLQQLHAIARTGKTIILSVHQPSQEAFDQLDQILLLSASGHQMYCGPRDGLPRYFDGIGRPCPPNRSFPDHMLSIVSADDVSETTAKPLSETSYASLEARANGEPQGNAQVDPENPALNPESTPNGLTRTTEDSLSESSQPHAQKSSSASASQAEQSTPNRKRRDPNLRRSFVTQLLVLYKRELLNVLRNPGLLLTHVVVSVILGLLVGGVYYQVSGNLAGFQNRAGAFYFTIVFLALSSASALEAFISERAIFVSEGAGRFYSPLAFFIPKVSLDWLLLRILPSLIFGTILYFMMGLRTDGGRFGVFLAVLFLVSVTSSSLCVLVSLAVPSVAIANVVALVAILIFLCFGGFLVNGASIPSALRWLPKLSFVTYAFEALMINELHGLTFSFRTVGIGPVLSLKGDSFLDQLGLSHNTLGRDLGILAAMVGIYISAACVLLYLRVKAGRMMRMRP